MGVTWWKITEGESFDITALRELFEEAGVLGTATDYDENIIPKWYSSSCGNR